MSNSTELSDRISKVLESKYIPYEIKRFGGFSYFMTGGKVIAAAVNANMLVKCKPEMLNEILKQPNTQTVPDAAGEPQKDMFLVDSEAIETEEALIKFLEIGLSYADK
ncbi:MAG: hypothetical protein HOP31_03635 [Ignavibacteria bacterium]|nr:hypothetical protein [Ignavibacteria bacterium]